MISTDIAYRYVGETGPRAPFIVGVPARDIQEWELMADPEMAELVALNASRRGAVYERVEAEAEPARAKTKIKARVESDPIVEVVDENHTDA